MRWPPILLLLCLAAPGAQARDPFPPLPAGGRLAVVPRLDGPAYDAARACLAGLGRETGADYYAAVVADAGGASPAGAVPFVDALYDAWRGRLDPQRHVLIALGIDDRSIAIHPGDRWADLGFERDAISRTIDASAFARHARRGDYPRALCALAETVDRQLGLLAARPPSAPPPPRERTPQPVAPPAPAAASGSGAGGWFMVPAGLLVLALLVLWRARRASRARRRALAELETWTRRLGNAAERLLELENRHPYYFAGSGERYAGDSRKLDQRCADAVNLLFLLYGKARELQGDAQRLIERGGRFAVAPYERAVSVLRDQPVTVETGEVEERRRIFLPLSRAYQGTAQGLLEDLDKAYGEALDLLAEVEAVERRAEEGVVATGDLVSRAQQAIERRGELGLDAGHLVGALAAARRRRRQALELKRRDPIAAAAALDEVRAELRALAERAAAGNRVIETLRGPVAERGRTLRAEVGRLRAAGWRLLEPGFDPDLRLDHGLYEAQRVERAVAAGDEEEAAAQLERLEQGMAELGEQLAACERARREVPQALQELAAARRRLADRIPAARRLLDDLVEEHAAAAFAEEADNLEQLAALLDDVGERRRRITEAHGEERYLSALADLELARAAIADGEGLLDAIDAIAERLASARREARDLAAGCGRRLDRLRALAAGDRPGLGSLAAAIDEALSNGPPLLARLEQPRPHWPRLATELAALDGRLEVLVRQVEEALAARDAAASRAGALADELAELARRVEEERRDRPHVAAAVDGVRRRLAALEAGLDSPSASGPALAEEAEAVARAVAAARRSFAAEIELAQAAEAALARARSRYRAVADRAFGYGLLADARDARRLLEDAERAAADRRWDRVVELAQQAESAAAEAEVRAAEEERRRRAEDERRWAALQAAQAARTTTRRAVTSVPASIASSRSSFGSRPSRSGGSRWGGSRSGGSRW